MQYRSFGKLDFKPSALGFGTMRLPVIGENTAKIDEKKTAEMIYYAIDNGVNYIDTAYVYHQGQSEIVLGKILKKSYKEKVKIASKLPVWLLRSKDDLDKHLNEQLKRLQTDHINFYLLHALNQEKWQKVLDLKIIEWAERKKSEGKIKHLGFSFHDEYPLFEKIINYYGKWEFCQIQYNFLDENYQAGVNGLKYAAQKGLAIVVMEPLKGGKLAVAPTSIKEIWDKAINKRTPVDWALQWLWNQPEVSLVLSGMSTLEQVKENMNSANNSQTKLITEKELKLFQQVKEKYKSLAPIPCTGCKYCLPCPMGVNIPKVFEVYNEGLMYDDLVFSKKQYSRFNQKEKAENCVACKKCESLCPQKINISEELKRAEKLLSDNK